MKKHANLFFRIMKNKLAMKGVGKPIIYKLDHAITMRCNARCTYCEIWKIKEMEKMQLEDYEKLFSEINLSWLHLTGGETFIRRDYYQIAILADEMMDNLLVIDSPTNASFPETIEDQCSKVLKKIDCQFEIGISMDGIERIHNKLRGIPNGWQKCLETYDRLKKLSEEYDNFGVHINHYLNPDNIDSFDEFVEALEKRDININDLSIEVARISPYFQNEHLGKIDFTKEKVIERLDGIIERYNNNGMSTVREKLRVAYLKEMINFLNGGKTVVCSSGWSSYYLDQNGFLYACQTLSKIPLGNVKEKSIKELLDSENLEKWRKKYHNCQICWSGCEGVTSLVQGMPITFFR